MRSTSVGESDTIHRTGTVALVWGVDRVEDWPDLIQLRGELLVSITELQEEEMLATVVGVETAAPVDESLVNEAQAALRTYLAATAEAGEGGNVTVTLKPDPVVASHQVASLVRISAPELQEILEAGDASARLERAVQVLRRETGLIRTTMGARGA